MSLFAKLTLTAALLVGAGIVLAVIADEYGEHRIAYILARITWGIGAFLGASLVGAALLEIWSR